MKKYLQGDVIIIGGGVVGLSLALLLKQNGCEPLLIDHSKAPAKPDLSQTDLRVSAINAGSSQLLQQLGVWQSIQALRVSPYQKMQVWDATGSGQIDFDAHRLGLSQLGHIIENSVMRYALWQACSVADIPMYFDTPLQKLQKKIPTHLPSHGACVYEVTDESGQCVEAELLVAADGANSWCRRQLRIDWHEKPYQQNAIVATIATERSHGKVARQRFMPTGPLALLPLLDPHQCSIVWSADIEESQRLLLLEDQAFCQDLTSASDACLGAIQTCSKRVSFPLISRHVNTYVKDGVALVGDAAHTIHPLAGQGLNLGLADALALSQVIARAKAKGRDPYRLSNLQRYEQARRPANQIMLLAMQGFKQLFGNTHPILTPLRHAGLQFTNWAVPLKHQFAWRALGLS